MTAEQKYWYWWSLSHKVHHTMSATDDTFIASQHPLCPVCNPDLVKGAVKPWTTPELDEPTRSNTSLTGTTAAATETFAPIVEAPATITMAISAWAAEARDGLTRSRPRQFYSWIPESDQLAPSALIFKGMPLAWKSQEAEPEHVFHWNDDPRKHPWCRKCQERVVPKGTFVGTPTERPAPPTSDDWAAKEIPA